MKWESGVESSNWDIQGTGLLTYKYQTNVWQVRTLSTVFEAHVQFDISYMVYKSCKQYLYL